MSHKGSWLTWTWNWHGIPGRILLRWPTDRDMKKQSLRISLASYHESTMIIYVLYVYIYIYIYRGLWSTNQSLLIVCPWYPLGYGDFTSWYSSHLWGFWRVEQQQVWMSRNAVGGPAQVFRGICVPLLRRLETSAFIFVGESDLNWVFRLFVAILLNIDDTLHGRKSG